MRDNKAFIIEQYKKVKAHGFLPSNRRNNTGIGKTFEDYIGVEENNIDEPDLAGFEIKSHREESESYVTLFTLAPSFPKGANAYLLRTFGVPNEDNPILKKLHTSMFANHANTFMGKLSFRLINDRVRRELRIAVCEYGTDNVIDQSVGYTYADVEAHLIKKLKNLFFVSAERKYEGGKEHFFFNHAEIYTQPSMENLLKMIDEGDIMYDIRIGSYKSGRNIGKPHDHGSGFRIKECNICKLYANYEKVD